MSKPKHPRRNRTIKPAASALRDPLALEPRLLFDAAAADTAHEVLDSSSALTPAPEGDDGDTGALLAALADTPASERRELVVVDTSVEGYQSLVDALDGSQEVILLQPGAGVQGLSDALQGYADIDALHLITHGSDQGISLAGDWVTGANLDSYREAFEALGSVLGSEGDLLLYGCDLAGSREGEALLGALAELTGADVAASDDPTGAAALGGDWQLEWQRGTIDSTLPSEGWLAYDGLLAQTTLSFSNGVADASFHGGSGVGDKDGAADDGELGSTDIPGLNIEVAALSDVATGATTGTLDWTANLDGGNTISGLYDPWSGPVGMSIREANGAEFQLNGFRFFDYYFNDVEYTVKGYRNGSEVASTTFTSASSGGQAQTVTLNSSFDNVDEVRIFTTTTDKDAGTLNDILIDSAVAPNSAPRSVPSPPTTWYRPTPGQPVTP